MCDKYISAEALILPYWYMLFRHLAMSHTFNILSLHIPSSPIFMEAALPETPLVALEELAIQIPPEAMSMMARTCKSIRNLNLTLRDNGEYSYVDSMESGFLSQISQLTQLRFLKVFVPKLVRIKSEDLLSLRALKYLKDLSLTGAGALMPQTSEMTT
ncbi:uncharacterized protein ACLA_044690 [Aspergillus clavatus NRRL 1]|uniref:F-box domain protein n=1 Tax=Aspergillus clavatus (strain ATCC 1007 / CBS 513.65 / DSM 816 / NCTC 3887 / NRRL 1 / QM 1276 / 107) TaxID=344612 RepID=A1C8W2_ASPCL|nr:uncharacterized protein ACLA_044690 [Aspergillus clavatus NRRL 1]EAW13749.1 hypothetical protein ACLA_044690 [Aspergillus clavatus NRRL 1]